MTISRNRLVQSFNKAAKSYNHAGLLQKTVLSRLIESFDEISIKPRRVLDLGSGTGLGSLALQQCFKKAEIYQLDFSEAMLKSAIDRSERRVCADAVDMPFADNSFDIIFSNLMIQWCPDLHRLFTEIKRTLRAEGLFLFSTLGTHTLKELRESWRKVDGCEHVNTFLDMHNVGDDLLKADLQSPVLHVEHLTLNYTNCRQLLLSLKGIGSRNMNPGRRKTLTGKERLKKMMRYYEEHRQEGYLPASYEVIYGHAWQVASESDAQTISFFKRSVK